MCILEYRVLNLIITVQNSCSSIQINQVKHQLSEQAEVPFVCTGRREQNVLYSNRCAFLCRRTICVCIEKIYELFAANTYLCADEVGAEAQQCLKGCSKQQLQQCCSSSDGISVKGGVRTPVFTISLRVGEYAWFYRPVCMYVLLVCALSWS